MMTLTPEKLSRIVARGAAIEEELGVTPLASRPIGKKLMSKESEQLKELEALESRRKFFQLPLETRLRNTCPGCGCRLIGDDFERALVFVLGPPKTGRCQACGWTGER